MTSTHIENPGMQPNGPLRARERAPRSPWWLAGVAVAVGVLCVALLYPFVDRDYRVNYQFDTPVFAQHVTQFRAALESGQPSRLPKLASWPPYFDAYDVLLTGLTAVTAAVGRVFPAIAHALPSVEAQTNFWARWMSLGFHGVGMAFLWLLLMRLYARPLVAIGLTMLVALAPTVIAMDIGRNDWGVLGCLCVVLYFCVCTAQGDHRARTLIGLGASSALLVTLKLNGPVFAVFVAFAAFAVMRHRGTDTRRISILLAAFMLPLIMLSFRQLYYFGDVFHNVVAQLQDLRRWSAASPKPSLFYYSWDILESQGTIYRLLMWASVPAVLLSLFVRPSLTGLFVFGSFSLFLISSLTIDYGFARGGYHLLPLFVMMIAVALAFLETVLRSVIARPRLATMAAGVLVAVLLAEPLTAVARNYATRAALMRERPAAVMATRTLPAEWMARTFPRGTRVATLLSYDLALIPPIHTLGFVFDRTLLRRNGDPLPSTFEPPPLPALRSTADVFVMSDVQEDLLWSRLAGTGVGDTTTHWQSWLETLRREVPSVAFSSPNPGYNYRRVEVFILDPAANAAALQAGLPSDQPGLLVRGPSSDEVQHWRRALTDRSPAVRIEAANALRAIGPDAKAAIPDLLACLHNDTDQDVRINVTNAIWSMGAEAAPAIEALVLALSDGNAQVRLGAAGALGAIGSKARTALPGLGRALVGDSDAYVREQAAKSIGVFAPDATDLVPSLTQALKDRESFVRIAAAYVLAAIGPDATAAIPALTLMLKDKDAVAREAATYALTKLNARG